MTDTTAPYATLTGQLEADPLTCFRHGVTEILHGCKDLAFRPWTRAIATPGCLFQTARLINAALSTGQPLPTYRLRLFALGDHLSHYCKGDRIVIFGQFRRMEEHLSILEFVVLGIDFALDESE